MDFDRPVSRENTNSIKWNRKAIGSICSNENAEPFWVADMDFIPEPHAAHKGKMIAESGVYGYPVFENLTDYAAQWVFKRHGWKVPSERILYSMGLLHGVAASISYFTPEGGRILVPSPMYRPFREIVHNLGRILIEHNLSYDGSFHLDRKRFLEDAEQSDAILFCSPQNPTGIVFTDEELAFVLETAKRLQIPVISDEIHSDLTYPSCRHIPMGLANEGIGADTITLFAPSKTFNVAGEHCGFIVFSDEEKQKFFARREEALRLREPGYVIGELTQAVYSEGLEYNQELCAYLEDTAIEMENLLKDSPLHMIRPHASYVAFINASSLSEKAEKEILAHPERYPSGEGGGYLSRYFGVNAGVCVNDGTWFGPDWKDYIRFNFGTSRDRVLKALERMISVF